MTRELREAIGELLTASAQLVGVSDSLIDDINGLRKHARRIAGGDNHIRDQTNHSGEYTFSLVCRVSKLMREEMKP